jgi:GDPmannose 4,6-dehydratase
MWQMLQQAEPNDYVIATGETHSLHDFVAEAFGVLGIDWKPHVMTGAEFIRPSEIMVSRADPQAAARKLGWSARTRMAGVVEQMVRSQQAMLASA